MPARKKPNGRKTTKLRPKARHRAQAKRKTPTRKPKRRIVARTRAPARRPAPRSRFFKARARTTTKTKRRYSPHFKKKITIKKRSVRFARGIKISKAEVRRFREKRVTGQPGVIKATEKLALDTFKRRGEGRYIFRAVFRVPLEGGGHATRAFSVKRAKATSPQEFRKIWRNFRNFLSFYMNAYSEGEAVIFDGVDIEYTE